MASGTTVSLKCCPTTQPRSAAPPVVKKPMKDEPVPAIERSGSIASALKFGMMKPNRTARPPARRRRAPSGGGPSHSVGEQHLNHRDDEEADQRAMRQPPHAEAFDQRAIGHRRAGHGDGDGAEKDREQLVEAVDALEDLLRAR